MMLPTLCYRAAAWRGDPILSPTRSTLGELNSGQTQGRCVFSKVDLQNLTHKKKPKENMHTTLQPVPTCRTFRDPCLGALMCATLVPQKACMKQVVCQKQTRKKKTKRKTRRMKKRKRKKKKKKRKRKRKRSPEMQLELPESCQPKYNTPPVHGRKD